MSKYVWEAQEIQSVKSENLVCESCKFKGETVATCIAYENIKPKSVLLGENCQKFERRDMTK